jgi:hypothetical protein
MLDRDADPLLPPVRCDVYLCVPGLFIVRAPIYGFHTCLVLLYPELMLDRDALSLLPPVSCDVYLCVRPGLPLLRAPIYGFHTCLVLFYP